MEVVSTEIEQLSLGREAPGDFVMTTVLTRGVVGSSLVAQIRVSNDYCQILFCLRLSSRRRKTFPAYYLWLLNICFLESSTKRIRTLLLDIIIPYKLELTEENDHKGQEECMCFIKLS